MNLFGYVLQSKESLEDAVRRERNTGFSRGYDVGYSDGHITGYNRCRIEEELQAPKPRTSKPRTAAGKTKRSKK